MASTDEVKKLAALARLSIPEDGLEKLASEFDAILAYVSKLDELKLPKKSEAPTPVLHNVFRPDGEPHEKGKYTKALVEQFPEHEGNHLSVKQIIKND